MGTFLLKMQSQAICRRKNYRRGNVHVLLTRTIARTIIIKADATNHYFHVYKGSHMGVLAAPQ